jgi:hypothetical protein
MNWRALLEWGPVLAGVIIFVLAAIDGDWLFIGVCLPLGIGVLLFEVHRTRRREFR